MTHRFLGGTATKVPLKETVPHVSLGSAGQNNGHKKSKAKKPNAVVWYPACDGGLKEDYLEGCAGRQWNFNVGKIKGLRYFVKVKTSGPACSIISPMEYEPVSVPPTIGEPPQRLWRGLHPRMVGQWLRWRDTMMEKVQMWATVGMAGLLVFLILILLGELGKKGG